jgi:GH18 family chitinase
MLAREMMEEANTDEIDVDWEYEYEETDDDGEEWED